MRRLCTDSATSAMGRPTCVSVDIKSKLLLAMHADGYNAPKVSDRSMTIVMFTILNLAPEERVKKENVLITAIIPGPDKPIQLFSFFT